MKKRTKNILYILLVVINVIVGVRCYQTASKIDENAPIISFSEKMITYVEGEDRSVLLKDVSARDNLDGDVSDTINIEKIVPNEDKQKAIVTYAAIDKSYNMVKVSRAVNYKTTVPNTGNKVNGDKPIMYLKTNQITIKINSPFQLKDFIATVIDNKDLALILLDKISVVGTYNINAIGTYSMSLYVIDSDGNESNRETVQLIVGE